MIAAVREAATAGEPRIELADILNRYADRRKIAVLPAAEFIRRFLQHVLPDGFMRIRHYGFLANRTKKQTLARCREHLAAAEPELEPVLKTAAINPPPNTLCLTTHPPRAWHLVRHIMNFDASLHLIAAISAFRPGGTPPAMRSRGLLHPATRVVQAATARSHSRLAVTDPPATIPAALDGLSSATTATRPPYNPQ